MDENYLYTFLPVTFNQHFRRGTIGRLTVFHKSLPQRLNSMPDIAVGLCSVLGNDTIKLVERHGVFWIKKTVGL
jgi:hypothetical protein